MEIPPAGADSETLQSALFELSTRCQHQAAELTELRAKVRQQQAPGRGDSTAASSAAPGREARAAPVRPSSAVSTGVQTDAAAPVVGVGGLPFGEGAEELSDQLDKVHQEVGEKTRELRRAQESIRMLQRELSEQRLVVEQYRSQVDMLEEQLNSALMKRRREAGEDVAARLASGPGRSRAKSALGARPAAESDGAAAGKGGSSGGGPSRPGSSRVPGRGPATRPPSAAQPAQRRLGQCPRVFDAEDSGDDAPT